MYERPQDGTLAWLGCGVAALAAIWVVAALAQSQVNGPARPLVWLAAIGSVAAISGSVLPTRFGGRLLPALTAGAGSLALAFLVAGAFLIPGRLTCYEDCRPTNALVQAEALLATGMMASLVALSLLCLLAFRTRRRQANSRLH